MDERILNLYERTQRLMNQAAQCVDIDEKMDALYNFLKGDAYLLEDIDHVPFFTTPLHIAASDINIPLAMEVMKLKPSFARKLDPDGWSPMHLALQKGKTGTEMVRHLLQVDSELVRVKGKKGVTPLHYLAEREEHLDLLAEFLKTCPDSIVDATVQNDTALHIAVSKNQTQIVSQLLASGVNVNIKNLEGNTAWDILQGQKEDNKKLRDMLHRAGALPGSSLSTVTCCAGYLGQLKSKFGWTFQIEPFLELKNVSDERRSALLVVVALLVTVTYQAVLSPPGGIWPDDRFNDNAPHAAGTAIGMRGWPFWLFLICNSVTFVFSNATIFLLAPIIGKFRLMFWALTIFLWVCYFNSLIVITHAPIWTFYIVVSAMPIHILITACPVLAMRIIKRFWNHTFFCWWTRSKHNQPSCLLNRILKRNDGEKSQA